MQLRTLGIASLLRSTMKTQRTCGFGRRQRLRTPRRGDFTLVSTPPLRAGPCRRDRDHRPDRSRGRRGGGRPAAAPAADLALVARAAADRPRRPRGVPAARQGRQDGRPESRRPHRVAGAHATCGGGARDGRRPPPERQESRDRVRAVAGPGRSAERGADGRGPRLERADHGCRPERDRAEGGRGGGAARRPRSSRRRSSASSQARRRARSSIRSHRAASVWRRDPS